MPDQPSWVKEWQNWIERRDQCNIENVYEELHEVVEENVGEMNGILKERGGQIYYCMDDAGEAKRFSVRKMIVSADVAGHAVENGSVRFCILESGLIEVVHYSDPLELPKHILDVSCEWDGQEGKCVIFCEYKTKSIDAQGSEVLVESVAQISERALGEFFFGFKVIDLEM